MKIDYLFSKNKKVGSRLISWAASFEKLSNIAIAPSHVAVLIENTFVIESVATSGVRIIPYTEWSKINEELEKIPVYSEINRSTLQSSLYSVFGKSYDWTGILFFAWRYLGLIVLNKAMPSVNRMNNKKKFFCTEFAGRLESKDYSMMSPAKLCSVLKLRAIKG